MVESFQKRLGIKKLFKISFGLFSALILLYLLFNAGEFVPEGKEMVWVLAFLSYGILGTFVFAQEDIRTKLGNISFFKSIPRFVLFFAGSLFFFAFVLGLVDPFSQIVLGIFEGIPTWLQIVQIFVIVTIETSFFIVYLTNRIGMLGSSAVAGLFHMFIWVGNPIINFVGAFVLFFIFNLFHYQFGVKNKSKEDPIPVIAFHSAYNFIKIGIILAVI